MRSVYVVVVSSAVILTTFGPSLGSKSNTTLIRETELGTVAVYEVVAVANVGSRAMALSLASVSARALRVPSVDNGAEVSLTGHLAGYAGYVDAVPTVSPLGWKYAAPIFHPGEEPASKSIPLLVTTSMLPVPDFLSITIQ